MRSEGNQSLPNRRRSRSRRRRTHKTNATTLRLVSSPPTAPLIIRLDRPGRRDGRTGGRAGLRWEDILIVRPVCPVFPGKDPPHLTEGGREGGREGRRWPMPIAPEKGRCTRMGRGSGGERSNQQPTVFHLPQVRQTKHAHTWRRQGRIRKDHLCSR